MVNSLQLAGEYRDLWGATYARLSSRMMALAYSPDCYRPKFYSAPAPEQRSIPIGGFVRFTMPVTPGAFLVGLLYAGAAPGPVQNFLVQVTDLSLGHKFFSEPVPAEFFAKPFLHGPYAGGHRSQLGWLLEAPHPVTGNGQFMIEFWNGFVNSGIVDAAAVTAEMYFMVAEPRCNTNG